MDIEAIVNKYERLIPAGAYTLAEGIRAALTEADAAMAMEHNLKMLQVEATMQNLVERIRQLDAEYEQKIAGLESEAILSRALSERIRQLEAERGLSETAIRCAVARGWCHQKNASKEMDVDLAIAISDEILAILDAAPKIEAERVPDVRCKCCGYLVTESEHRGCLRSAIDGHLLASLRLAAEALHALTDRNITYIGNDAVFPFESNAQAFNHMIDARPHAKEAMAMLAAAPAKEGE